MTKGNSINPTTAVNSNESIDTINTTTSDNLFNDEQNTPDAPIPPKQQRIGKQQRKSDFADFKETYLMPSKLTKRHSVNIEESVWEQLERVARILGDRGSNVGSYIIAILSEHLYEYRRYSYKQSVSGGRSRADTSAYMLFNDRPLRVIHSYIRWRRMAAPSQ